MSEFHDHLYEEWVRSKSRCTMSDRLAELFLALAIDVVNSRMDKLEETIPDHSLDRGEMIGRAVVLLTRSWQAFNPSQVEQPVAENMLNYFRTVAVGAVYHEANTEKIQKQLKEDFATWQNQMSTWQDRSLD